ncbi:hypothetical protein FHR66_001714 [Xanthomonas sp. F4]
MENSLGGLAARAAVLSGKGAGAVVAANPQ